MSRDGVAQFDSSQLIEEWEEDEVPKEGEAPTAEAKKKKKSSTTKVVTDIAHQHGLGQKRINQFYEEECQMANHDRIIHETYAKKNELESYIYEMRSKINEKYANVVTAASRDSLLAKLSENEEWLYADGAKASKNAYVSKLEELKKMGDPISQRAREFDLIPENIQQLLHTIDNIEQTLSSTVNLTFRP